MRLLTTIVLLVCLAGCSVFPRINPDYRPYIEHEALYEISGEWRAKQNLGIYTTHEVGRYLSVFVDRWVDTGLPGTRDELVEAFNTIELHWQPTSFIDPEKSEQTVLVGKVNVRRFREVITVFVYDCTQKKNPRLGQTALGHELIHVALWATTDDSQADHFGLPNKEWPIRYLDLQEEVNASFR